MQDNKAAVTHVPNRDVCPVIKGIISLEEMATKTDQVAVLNILGAESRKVSPISHVYSEGNIVFGTAPGRGGEKLQTLIGAIPVFDSVHQALLEGHSFNAGVIYTPPNAVVDGVKELVQASSDLKKIVIVTEKVPACDAREIRAITLDHGIVVIGANSLGIADSWNKVRIGGALAGDKPEETLRPGSIAIYSNSGNFTTTLAEYLQTSGWGTTTLISSGKDVYINFGPQEFADALSQDGRSKGAVIYVEPGGYYEQNLKLTKPTVACVVGAWKSNLSRPVGHAGAFAGTDDGAVAKEEWFKELFGVDDIYRPDNPVCTKRGAVVRDIAHVPDAMRDVMRRNALSPDFAPKGSLTLKPWFVSDRGLKLPKKIRLPAVPAMAPYREQIEVQAHRLGAKIERQNMKDKSGASLLAPDTQIAHIHGYSVLKMAANSYAANLTIPLLHEWPDTKTAALMDLLVTAESQRLRKLANPLVEAAKGSGSTPNMIMTAALSIVGEGEARNVLVVTKAFIDAAEKLKPRPLCAEQIEASRLSISDEMVGCLCADSTQDHQRALRLVKDARSLTSDHAFFDLIERTVSSYSADAVMAAIVATISWMPLVRKRISRLTAESMGWHVKAYAVMIAALGGSASANINNLDEMIFDKISHRKPLPHELRYIRLLLGLLATNGPGAISLQGVKGAVSADGPQTPSRIQIQKAYAGFLTHSGYAHGGNGFEGISFLIDVFADSALSDPWNSNHKIELEMLARRVARRYKTQKDEAKDKGNERPKALPGINHPVFRGRKENIDPREQYVFSASCVDGTYNIFNDFYRILVRILFEEDVTQNVFCVNIDGVIASLLLAMLWPDLKAGRISQNDLEQAAFSIFLLGRIIGAAAEIDDHMNRGRNMDMRTPASKCAFVY